MHWINSQHIRWACMAAALTLGGCATQDTILPPSDRKMVDIYREAMNEVDVPVVEFFNPQDICGGLALEESSEDCQQKLADYARVAYQQLDSVPVQETLDYVQYTRTTRTELDVLFPRLENPDLVIYVYPHLATRTRAPIPGYTTVVPLYERVEYRLPGETLLSTPSPQPESSGSVGGAP